MNFFFFFFLFEMRGCFNPNLGQILLMLG